MAVAVIGEDAGLIGDETRRALLEPGEVTFVRRSP
jgi:hypothetical protein